MATYTRERQSDRRQDAVGLGSNYLTVLGYEQEVSTTGLFYILAGSCIQIHILIESGTMCVHNGIQAHRIVQTSLDVAGAVRCRTVVVTHADGDRLSAALEVRANRSTEYTVLILICRLYTDNSVAAKHVRTDV